MTSPEEIQVADGEEDVYLWPNAEIRQRALDAIVKRAERTADARYRQAADKVLADLEAKIKQANENFIKQAAEASAAYTRLEGLIATASQKMAEIQQPPAPPLPSQPLCTAPEIHDLREKIEEIGSFFYKLHMIFQEVETSLSNCGVYNQEMKERLLLSLFSEKLRAEMTAIHYKVSNIVSRLGVYHA